MTWFSVALFMLLLGTAVCARGGRPTNVGAGQRHRLGTNPFIQARHPLTQGFLCDWCVVGVEDGQVALRQNMNQIEEILNKASAFCVYCPVPDQCTEVFQTDIPNTINEYLNMTANDVCTEAGLCDANATIQGMVMNSLRGEFARDRVIKRMLMRARVMQQKMIRIILGEDYMCTSCLDIVRVAREALLNNDTEHEFVDFLAPLCAYLPDVYQAECNEFVQGLPDLLRMVANDLLTDSVCTEVGFCNQTKSTPDVSATLPDVVSRLGLPGVLPVMPGRHGPWQLPGPRPGRVDPFQYPLPGQGRDPIRFPGEGRSPYSYPGRPVKEHSSQSRPSGRNPFQFPSNTRPQQQNPLWAPIKWPGSTNSRPSKPQKPQDPSLDDPIRIPDLDDYLGRIGGIMDSLPSLPGMPNLDIPDVDLSRLPGQRRDSQGQRRDGQRTSHNRGGKKGHKRRQQRSIGDWTETDRFLGLPKDTTHEYLPEDIPDAGITILENGADENCELCKLAVTATSTWLEENAPKLKKMMSKLVLPLCKVFPSPMREDCSSDMRELIQTSIERLTDLLQPESVCTELGMCVAPEEREEFNPTTERVDVATEGVQTEHPNEEDGVNWPIPILNRFKDFKVPI